ncbi:methylisocitrate lyase [Trinickia symbiotica]|uniref:Carboxyvinyl-carboxyphosphonate phosphorylmutase n=1 Tax=Trinickia symbiotica TaxID=863227 RepID=A0A2N7WLE7_9BURK|nr:isocitrate lyase/PEP mutase family protein [Trinickia symbiotica]PMS30105.1 carboxyvinyl-carboxyphosphonate phosphorylmutase [Trinickia symbiotica]PPK41099.1 methylisocitrate lyase [Trinickia symbiotica]
MTPLASLLAHEMPVIAPLVLGPMSAQLAQRAGFRALYLGGGSVGYDKAVTEANLNATEMAQLALDIRAACDLPLILDAAGGWGDAMHVRRTVRLAEAAGFAAIELEDQHVPKRAHHHIGIDYPVPVEVMVEKIREAVAARRSPDFLIIGRTNLARENLDEAVTRAHAYKAAGADILFVLTFDAAQLRVIGRSLPAPLMFMTATTGLAQLPMPPAELAEYGVRLIVDPVTPMLAIHRALRDCYTAMADLRPAPLHGASSERELEALKVTIDLEALLAIERRTTERPR